MSASAARLNPLALRLGSWSAAVCAIAFILFTLCFIAIAVTAPLFIWSDMAAYQASVTENPQFLKYLAQASVLVFALAFLVLVNSIHEITPPSRRLLSRLGLLFAVPFVVLSGLHYFVQITAVRHNIEAGRFTGLELFVQANPASVMLAVNMLGFAFMLGLSTLFLAPLFAGSRLANFIRAAFLVNAVSCLLGGIGFIFQWTAVVFVTINLGMGGALTAVTVALAVYFRRLQRLQPVGEQPGAEPVAASPLP